MGMGDEILVVKRDLLFVEGDFNGFISTAKVDYYNRILENIEYQIRSVELEKDVRWQQPIPYVWIINNKSKSIFLYIRDVTGNEGRLHNKYSGGVGGHIDKKELIDGGSDPIIQAMMRELKEEVIMEEYPEPKVVGYLNDNSNEVGKVHFGIVAIVETDSEVRPLEDMKHGRFYSLKEADMLFNDSHNDIETWTRISWPFVKDYLSKL